MSTKTFLRFFLATLPVILGMILMGATSSAHADDGTSLRLQATVTGTPSTATPTASPSPTPTAVDSPHDEENANCMMCHGNPDFHGIFENNESVSLYVEESELMSSVHADAGLKCVACHTNVSSYPHSNKSQLNCMTCHEFGNQTETKYPSLVVKMPYENKRAMVLEINDKCRTCHEDEYQSTEGSAHEKVFESGNTNAPVCVDCHGGHNTIKPGSPRRTIVDICGRCHESVMTSFNVSVHGETLLKDPTNPDVPTCINCHGVHNVRGPRQVTFRGDSVVTCGGCHKDETLMKKYGISTDVFDTYLNDFHGRTVTLFQEAGETSSNKATCYDCHGIHNIRRPTDSLSSVYPDNLQHTCQQCHADATIRFPAAWLSHNEITLEKSPLLFSLNIAYTWFLIPGTIGMFLLYIVLDARRRWLDKHSVLQDLVEEDDEEYDFEK